MEEEKNRLFSKHSVLFFSSSYISLLCIEDDLIKLTTSQLQKHSTIEITKTVYK